MAATKRRARDPAPAPPARASALVFLGADAGGSHSTVVVGRSEQVLGRADGPGAAMRPSGAATSAAVLADTARRAAAQAGIALPVDRAVVGAAGAGRGAGEGGVAGRPRHARGGPRGPGRRGRAGARPPGVPPGGGG